MKRYWSRSIRGIEPYTPGEQPRDRKYIKLNTNENPYPPSPAVTAAIEDAARDLRLYPDPLTTELNTAIAESLGVPVSRVFTGNGSDEVLAMCFKAFFEQDLPVLFPDVTYSFYPVYAELFGIEYKKVPLDESFVLSPELFCVPSGGVIFPNPNAPTGMAIGIDEVERIVASDSGRVVIVDEAYVDFGAQSAVPLTEKYPNLLVVQTFSKSRSLAGLRVGFAVGSEELIAGLNAVKNSFNSYTLDRLAIAAGSAAVRDRRYFDECVSKIIATREKTAQRLKELGFTVLPSKANFVFAGHPKKSAAELFTALRAAGVLVRYFSGERTKDFLRITIGTDGEMEKLLEILSKLVR